MTFTLERICHNCYYLESERSSAIKIMGCVESANWIGHFLQRGESSEGHAGIASLSSLSFFIVLRLILMIDT